MMEILREIPFSVDMNELARKVRLDPEDEELYPLLRETAERAQKAARPKAVVREAEVVRAEGRITAIGGTSFSNSLLDRNLTGVDRVYAYVVTCGRELDAVDPQGDPLMEYWLDTLRLQAVGVAMGRMTDRVKERFGIRKAARLNPGSLPQWPISEQTKVFSMIGDVEGAVGVTLTDSFLMRPLKSVSGFLYETEREYENCMLCRRFDCPGRRAPFDEKMAAEYGEYACGKP